MKRVPINTDQSAIFTVNWEYRGSFNNSLNKLHDFGKTVFSTDQMSFFNYEIEIKPIFIIHVRPTK